MTVATTEKRVASTSDLQFATFYVGGVLLGIDIRQVQEINHQLDVTPVPRAPDYVRGVINLRGEVATVVDLRRVLGLAPAEETRESRNLIVHWQGESIGLWVDRISDILSVPAGEICPPPANVDAIDGRFFHGVYTMDTKIVVILNIEQVFADRESKSPK